MGMQRIGGDHMRGTLFRHVAQPKLLIVMTGLLAAQTASAGMYVDNTLGEVRAEDIHKVASPRPAQLLFEFQTDGTANAKATKYVKPILSDEIKALGFVSELSDTPVAGGARLTVIMNDIPQKNAASKGFVTGLTFGLAGALVADDYDVTFTYAGGDGQQSITRTVHHRLYTKIGAKDPPPNATAVKKAEEAVRLVVRQVVAHGLNGIAGDAAFTGSPRTEGGQ